jgi:hypothetical protein
VNPGLPGAGVGAIFYIILALIMPLNELRLSLRGRSSRARWLVVGRQWAIAAGIVLTQVLGFLFLARLQLPLFSTAADPLLAHFDDALVLISVAGALIVASSVLAGRRLTRR